MNKIELATKKHSEGYNCAQAVACAYCDNVGLDEETLFQLGQYGRKLWCG